METVWDYKITKIEMEELGISEINKSFSEQDQNYMLASLFYIRGNKAKVEFYADKLPAQVKVDLYRTLTHQ
ncbi:MAG: hypothetical protein AB7E36_14825 [Salinivirgaceae bacterium]